MTSPQRIEPLNRRKLNSEDFRDNRNLNNNIYLPAPGNFGHVGPKEILKNKLNVKPGNLNNSSTSVTQVSISEMFVTYEEEFHESESNIRQYLAVAGKKIMSGNVNLGNNRSNIASLDVRLKNVVECRSAIEVAERAVNEMSRECRSLPNNGSLNQRVQHYRTILNGLKREFSDTDNMCQKEVMMYKSSNEFDPHIQARIDQIRMGDTSTGIQRGTDMMRDANRIADNTKESGVRIMSDLRGQREIIQQSRSHLAQIDQNLTNSRQVILQMSRRVLTNKIILISTALVLSLTLILLLFIKLNK